MEFTPEELGRLVQFFGLLFEIDQREKAKTKLRHQLVILLSLIMDLRKRRRKRRIKKAIPINTEILKSIKP